MAENDPIIRATTQVDTSGLRAGLEEANSINRSQLAILQEQYRETAAEVRQSVNRIVDAEKQAAEAISAGHQQLGATLQAAATTERTALDTLISKQVQEQASINAMKAAIVEAEAPVLTLSDAMQRLAIAQAIASAQAQELAEAEALATAAAEANATATGAMAAAHGRSVTEIQAVSGTLRTLESNGGIRAAERFLTMLPGLGAALQIAFPVVGAIALGEVLVRLWEKFDPVVQAEKNFEEVTKHVDQALGQLTERIQHVNVEILTTQLGKAAGLKLQGFYDDQAVARDKSNIQVLISQIELTQQRMAQVQSLSSFFSNPLQAINPFEIYGQFSDMRQAQADFKNIQAWQKELGQANAQLTLDEKQHQLAQAKEAKDRAEEAKRAASERAAALRRSQQELKSGYDEMLADLKSDHEVTKSEELAFRQNELQEVSQWGRNYVNLQRQINREIGTLQQEVYRQQDAEAKRHISEQKRIVEEGAQEAETTGAENGRGGANARLDYLQKALEDYKDVPQIHDAILAKIPEATRAAMREDSEALKTAVNEQYETWVTSDHRTAQEIKSFWEGVLRTYSTDAALTAEATKKVADATARLRQETLKFKELQAQQAEQRDIGELQASKIEVQQRYQIAPPTSLNPFAQTAAQKEKEELARIDLEELAVKQRTLSQELSSARTIYGEESNQYQQLVTKKEQLDQQYSLKKRQLDNQRTIDEIQNARRMVQQIDQEILRGVNQWIAGQKTFAQAMVETWNQILMSVIRDIEQIGVKWLEEHIIMKAISKIFGVDDGSTEATAKKIGNNTAVAESNAGVAGSDVFLQAIEAVPFPANLAVAPAAAAAVEAQMQTFTGMAAFAAGTEYVPNTGVAMVHQGERIMDARSNANLTRALANGGGPGGDTYHQQFHISNAFHPGPGGRFDANDHADQIWRSLQPKMRQFNR